jgi:hypothetical protein
MTRGGGRPPFGDGAIPGAYTEIPNSYELDRRLLHAPPAAAELRGSSRESGSHLRRSASTKTTECFFSLRCCARARLYRLYLGWGNSRATPRLIQA